MGKYSTVYQSVYSIFDSGPWAAQSIKTFPSNFVGNAGGNKYIRVSVVSNGVGKKQVNGVINIDIFTEAGLGTKETTDIADALDAFLENKIVGSVQCFDSSLNHMGLCQDNPSLHRSMYSIPFDFFGV